MGWDKIFQILKVVFIALGPALTTQIPMAPDLQGYAFWCSGVAALVAVVLAGAVLAKQTRWWPSLISGIVAAVFGALAYVAVNLIWTTEHGDARDVPYMLWVVGSYGLTNGALAFASAAAEKITGEKNSP